MKTGRLILLILIATAHMCTAQSADPVLLRCIPADASQIVTDHLGNFYLIKQSQISKYDSEGKLLFNYSELADGSIFSADVSDPLKILIFNPGFAKIKFLDQSLSLKKDFISLSDLGYPNASLVCTSYESGFWIFEPVNNQLIRFDNVLQVSQTSGNINDLAGLNHDFSPVFMTESENTLYVCEPESGIFIFDRFGAYLKTIPVKGVRSLQVFGDKLLFCQDSSLLLLDLKTYEEKKLQVPGQLPGISDIHLEGKRLYVLLTGKVCLYAI